MADKHTKTKLTLNLCMQAPASVCPGYKHVEAFSNDDDYYESEEEEEVSYVTLDLGDVEPQLVPNASAYRLIGLDTPTPYLQLHGTIMKGKHDFLLGTELIFTEDRENHDWNKRSLVHVANTEQRIAFQEVTLIPKNLESKSQGKQKASSTSADLSETDRDALAAAAAAGITTSDFVPPSAKNNAAEIDKLTGVTGPPTRAPRKKKPAASSTKKASRTKATKSAKAKGKEKEVLSSPEMHVMMEEDGIGDDNLEDIYMDQT